MEEDSDEAYVGNSSRSSGSYAAASTELAFESALKSARDRSDARLTVEHLLIALLDEESALELLNDSHVDLVALRAALSAHIDSTVPKSTKDDDPVPDPQLRSVLQRGVLKSMLTNKKVVTGADYIVAVLVQDDSFASRALRDYGLTVDVAENENIERYLAKNAEQAKEMEALQEKIRAQHEPQNASEDNLVVARASSTQSPARADVGHKVYTLRVLSANESEPVQFKGAISQDARLDLYIEETPFEVKFVASRVLRPVEEWPEIWRQGLVASVETSITQDGTRVEKLRLSDRIKRIELIGKHVDVKAFVERAEVTGKDGGPIEAVMVFNPVGNDDDAA